ncbi:MAG: T9SS type A sorting domain-containing protein, partial [Bacteroidota bacterium]
FGYKTTFTYKTGIDGFIELEIHDQYGNFITALVSESQPAGSYSVDWNAVDIAPGVYFYSLKVNGVIWVKKAIKIR